MTNKNLHDLMEEYIDSLDSVHEDEWYTTDQIMGQCELDGFVVFLQDKGYRIDRLKNRC